MEGMEARVSQPPLTPTLLVLIKGVKGDITKSDECGGVGVTAEKGWAVLSRKLLSSAQQHPKNARAYLLLAEPVCLGHELLFDAAQGRERVMFRGRAAL